MSRAVSRADAAFALTIGRDFSPFLTILIVFFSGISIFEFRLNLNVSNEFLATQFPKLVKLERRTALSLAKKRPHQLTRTPSEKRASSCEKFFHGDLFGVATIANRTHKNRFTGTVTPISVRAARFSAPYRAPKCFCECGKPSRRGRLPHRCSRISIH